MLAGYNVSSRFLCQVHCLLAAKILLVKPPCAKLRSGDLCSSLKQVIVELCQLRAAAREERNELGCNIARHIHRRKDAHKDDRRAELRIG